MKCHFIFVLSWRGEKERESWAARACCNTDYNKVGEKMREER